MTHGWRARSSCAARTAGKREGTFHAANPAGDVSVGALSAGFGAESGRPKFYLLDFFPYPDFAALRSRTAIARIIELTAHASRLPRVPRALAEPLVLMVAPLAPHIAEELWQRLGHPSLTNAAAASATLNYRGDPGSAENQVNN